jgi:hypothetical protein
MERKILFDILASRAQEYPGNATIDFKASADITNTKKVRRLAAVLLPLSGARSSLQAWVHRPSGGGRQLCDLANWAVSHPRQDRTQIIAN